MRKRFEELLSAVKRDGMDKLLEFARVIFIQHRQAHGFMELTRVDCWNIA